MEITEQPTTDMASTYSFDKSKLPDFALNPWNIRSPESYRIVPITRETESGVSEFDGEGNRLGFQLGDFQCTPTYRREFNQYLEGFLSIDGPKVHFSTGPNAPIITTWKMALTEGGPSKYWVVEGNTRLAIAQQLADYLGEDFSALIHYTHYKGNLSGEQLLRAAPVLGFNSRVPVLTEDSTLAVNWFRDLIAKGATPAEAQAQIRTTFLQSSDHPGWSTAKLSYVATQCELGVYHGLLTSSAAQLLNTEFISYYLRHWFTQVTGSKYRVGAELAPEAARTIKELMSKYGVEEYKEDTLRTADFRITSNAAWNAYLTWAASKMESDQKPAEQAPAPQEVSAEEKAPAEPVTKSDLAHFSENLMGMRSVFHEANPDRTVMAQKLVSPLKTALELVITTDPMQLESILTALANAVEALPADRIPPEAKAAIQAATKKTQGLHKASSI